MAAPDISVISGSLSIGRSLRLAGIGFAALGLTAAAAFTVENPWLLRPAVAMIIGGILVVVALRWPTAAIVGIFGLLPFLGLVRRLLIPAAGWTSYDPLLLLAPLVAATLLRSLPFGRRRDSAKRAGSPLILGLLLLTVLEAANPLRGSLLAGVTGLLFLAAPLLWFFVGRELANRRVVAVVLWTVLASAVVSALYGLREYVVGLFPWDAAWLKIGGYTALEVLGDIRPFATFASSAEYAMFVAIGLLIAVCCLLYRRLWALPAIPILTGAEVLSSTRGAVVVAALAILVVIGLRLPDAVLRVVFIAGSILCLTIVFQALRPTLEDAAIATNNTFIVHQVFGLTRPLDPQTSTLAVHWAGVIDGFRQGLLNPLGLGTAATNLASEKVLGSASVGAEIDVSNAFVGLGMLGGLLVITIIISTFRRAFLLCVRQPSFVSLAAVGVLIVSFGQWLNGGQYAVAPLVWFVIGWIARQSSNKPALSDPGPRAWETAVLHPTPQPSLAASGR